MPRSGFPRQAPTTSRYFSVTTTTTAASGEIGVTVSSVYHLASPAHWPRCRLKAAMKVNNSSCCAFGTLIGNSESKGEKSRAARKPRITTFTINHGQYGRDANLAAVRFLEQGPAQ